MEQPDDSGHARSGVQCGDAKALPEPDTLVALLADKFPQMFTTFGNGKTPNALVHNVVHYLSSLLPSAHCGGKDPLAGLVERLDRLCLTSTEDNRNFVLATESARNIVEIVREWIRSGAGVRHSLSSTHRGSE